MTTFSMQLQVQLRSKRHSKTEYDIFAPKILVKGNFLNFTKAQKQNKMFCYAILLCPEVVLL